MVRIYKDECYVTGEECVKLNIFKSKFMKFFFEGKLRQVDNGYGYCFSLYLKLWCYIFIFPFLFVPYFFGCIYDGGLVDFKKDFKTYCGRLVGEYYWHKTLEEEKFKECDKLFKTP